MPLNDADVGAAAGAGAGDDVGAAVAVDVAGGDADAAGEAGGVGEEARRSARCRLGAAEDLDMRPAAGAGAGDDVGEAVAVDVAGGDEDAAGERGAVGEEAREVATTLPVGAGLKTLTCGPPPGPAPVMMSAAAVAVDVAGGHADAAGEGGG